MCFFIFCSMDVLYAQCAHIRKPRTEMNFTEVHSVLTQTVVLLPKEELNNNQLAKNVNCSEITKFEHIYSKSFTFLVTFVIISKILSPNFWDFFFFCSRIKDHIIQSTPYWIDTINIWEQNEMGKLKCQKNEILTKMPSNGLNYLYYNRI